MEEVGVVRGSALNPDDRAERQSPEGSAREHGGQPLRALAGARRKADGSLQPLASGNWHRHSIE